MSHRVVFLWTVPRSVSTSFERMMSARGDHTVLDEPFSRSYYYGPDRRSDRYDETLTECSAPEVLERIEQAERADQLGLKVELEDMLAEETEHKEELERLLEDPRL